MDVDFEIRQNKIKNNQKLIAPIIEESKNNSSSDKHNSESLSDNRKFRILIANDE